MTNPPPDTSTSANNAAWYALEKRVIPDTGGDWFVDWCNTDPADRMRIVGLVLRPSRGGVPVTIESEAQYQEFLRRWRQNE